MIAIIVSIVKAAIITGLGYFTLLALNYKIVAKLILVLMFMICLNTVIQGCTPIIEKYNQKLEKLENSYYSNLLK